MIISFLDYLFNAMHLRSFTDSQWLHVVSLGGKSWFLDPEVPESVQLENGSKT